MWPTLNGWLSQGLPICLWPNDNQPEMYSMTTVLQTAAQGFAESLQQECSKPAQNVMIELYCCGPGLLFWLLLFQIRKGLGSSRFCCKDSANPVCGLWNPRVHGVKYFIKTHF